MDKQWAPASNAHVSSRTEYAPGSHGKEYRNFNYKMGGVMIEIDDLSILKTVKNELSHLSPSFFRVSAGLECDVCNGCGNICYNLVVNS